MIPTASRDTPPSTVMMWTVNDPVIEDARERTRQFQDIRAQGFGGIAAFVRCSSYSWSDPAARRALKSIGGLCARYGLSFWAGLDPRFVSHEILKQAPGLAVLMSGKSIRNGALNRSPIVKGGFHLRYFIPPRKVHTLHEERIVYRPLGLEKVYAVRRGAARGVRRLTQSAAEGDLVDITSSAHWKYLESKYLVDIRGKVPFPSGEGWEAIAFLRLETNHYDFSNPLHRDSYHAILRELLEKEVKISGLMWDEPGYSCSYGLFPAGRHLEKSYRSRTGRSLVSELWKLVLPALDGSEAEMRREYFGLVQESVNSAQESAARVARSAAGRRLMIGIHDTWHWESADMCDMNHGSLDLWRGLKAKRGGFVDLGSAHLLRDPASPFYRSLAAACILAASLGRHGGGKYAYNNCWTAGEDAAWQSGVMEQCARAMALFGTGWLAHIYGPAGIRGEEKSFLGLPGTPGYPDHCTWSGMKGWVRLIDEHLSLCGSKLPRANILLVFPVGTLMGLADRRADRLAEHLFDLLLALTDRHYQVDLVSAALAGQFDFSGGRLRSGDEQYDAAIFPLIDRGTPEEDWAGALRGRLPVHVSQAVPELSRRAASEQRGSILDFLGRHPRARLFRAPRYSWATTTPMRSGRLVTIIPSRRAHIYGGTLETGGRIFRIPRSGGMTRLIIPDSGEARFVP